MKIKAGEDLKPFLSDKISTHGYVRPIFDEGGTIKGTRWGDKDYALNCYETHHLHLDTSIRPNGWSGRTKDLLYIIFGRETAFLIMVGNHKSFDDVDEEGRWWKYRGL